ncbi:Thimet oligopeptidase [Mycena kentingensis (nom. inval.)]|nr:Thimet oligopeptidase [Mycena kentingensis (nom. inval.)]
MVLLQNAARRLLQPKRPRQLASIKWGGITAVGVAVAALAARQFSWRSPVRLRQLTGLKTLDPRGFLSTFTITPSEYPAMTPPQPPPSWTHTPADVLRLTKEIIEKDKAINDKIAALPSAECNFESVFVALVNADTDFQLATEPLSFYQNVSPSKELRDASTEADSLIRDYGVEASMRVDLYKAKLAAEQNIKASGAWDKLSPEEKRLVEFMVRDGKRAGLGLPEEQQETLKKLQKELSQVCLEFDKNFNEENGSISFTKEELDGVPTDVISGYTKRTEDGKEFYDVTYKTPDIFPVFKFANNPETRRRAYEGHESRLAINVPHVEKFLALRRDIAKVLSYPTWADYRTEVKMVGSAKAVVDFLDDLEKKLKPVGVKDHETLLAMKKTDHEERGLPFDGEFNIWDYRFYDRKFTEKTLDLDDMLVKEYFPVSIVVPAIMEIYQTMLGVRFEEIKGSTWHPGKLFRDLAIDAKDASGFLGYTYLDLFPREGKYSHAAVWPLLPGYTAPDGTRKYPLNAMVANLAKPTPDKPALMRHDDVVTFFHEMGHVFHGILSKTKFSRFHGTSVARDFVEAPSQMLENWCWEPEVLKKMSRHYKTNEPLSDELIEKIIKSRYVNVGLFFLRQVFFAKFDMNVHTAQEHEDYTLLWNRMREEISLVKSGNPCPGQGTFGHISGGYDAGYYGYTYSLVFASDMYATVFKGDPLDPARGKLYRDKILKFGGSREELDSLKDFLGRPPNSDAFLKELFGSVPGANLYLSSGFDLRVRIPSMSVQAERRRREPPPMSFPPSSSRTRPSRRHTTDLHQLDAEANQLIFNALERTNSAQPPTARPEIHSKGSFSKMSFSSMMGGLSGLSLSRTSTNNSTLDTERGRSSQTKSHNRSSSHGPRVAEDESRSRSRARSQSPFSFRRFRQQRDPSPTPQALPLTHSDVDLSDTPSSVRPRNAFIDGDDDSGDDAGETEDDEDWSADEDLFDPVTEANTEHNSIVAPAQDDAEVVDPLGEGVNVVVPPDPYFGSSIGVSAAARRNPRRRKSTRHEPLPLRTSRPVFQRDRCTITITQGDPQAKLGDRKRKRYIVASDLSEESRYAVEWGIGTVIRDGDEMMIVNVMESESKVDPPIPNAADRATKLRSQQERQGLAYILCRQATGLLQRTKLNVTVVCQAWHAKNDRHMLLDIVDYHEPTMLIVGSRGLGQLKGILLGSTSHYLIEKCSVPVMVARRRLKRPPRRSAHLATNRTHISLAEAGIDRVARKVDADVQVMRDELQREDDRRDEVPKTMEEEVEEEEGEGTDAAEEPAAGVKVAG